MTRTITIEIDMGRPCRNCGKPGSCQNGLCLRCTASDIRMGKHDHLIRKGEAQTILDKVEVN